MRVSANISMLFAERPFRDRFAAAALAGFEAVEIQFPYEASPEELEMRLAGASLRLVLINTPPGATRGMAAIPGAPFEAAMGEALRYARALGVPSIHVMAGEGGEDATFRANLSVAVAAAGPDVRPLIEPLNPFDVPGYHLADFGRAAEIATETGAGLLFDIYHCARIHGAEAVPGWIARCAPLIGHLQIAGVPGRHEPDRGDLPLAAILAALRTHAPGRWLGAEYVPAGRTEDGLGWLRRL